ncbi:unnamed protein product, partial [Aphanomyces euteiches]
MEKLQLSVRRELIVEAGAEKTTDLDDFQAWFAASQAQKRVIAKVALDELDAYRKRCENKRLLVTAHKASTSASKLGTDDDDARETQRPKRSGTSEVTIPEQDTPEYRL